MNRPTDPLPLLNRLFQLEYRSLPVYLGSCAPWLQKGDGSAKAQLNAIIANHRSLSQRVGEKVVALGGAVEPGKFPMYFTGLNDVSLQYLQKQLVAGSRSMIAQLESLAASAGAAPDVLPLVEEALGSERAHLETLERLTLGHDSMVTS